VLTVGTFVNAIALFSDRVRHVFVPEGIDGVYFAPMDDFLARTYTSVDVVFSRFVSTLVQRPEKLTILPIEPSEDTEGIPGNQFIFEPNASTVLERLLPRYVATRLYQAVLEAKASEESSRMVAMKNATENAEDLIEDLTISYNKVRQANITREMIEIASGANAR